jgi:protein O-mannosyl-transferase
MKSNNRTSGKKSSKPGQSGSNRRWPRLLVPLSIAVVTCAAFFPALLNDFVNWDDDKILVDNPYYRGFGWNQLKWMFTTFHMGHYQPLSWLSFAMDYLLWGMDPFGYHLTNLLLHAANSVLFYFVSWRLLGAALSISDGKKNWQLSVSAGLSALLFAIHPLRVESVAWATERRDVLSGFFFLITVDCYLRAAATREGSTRRRWLRTALVGYVLSLLSKAIGITLPAVLLLMDVYPLRRLQGGPLNWLKFEYRAVLYEKLPFVVLAVGFAIAALFAQHTTDALKPLDQFDVVSRVLQASFAFMFYLLKTLFPIHLSPIYELPVDVEPWFWLFLLSGVVTVTLTVALYYLAQRWPAAATSWLYYVIVLAPVTGIAQSGPQLVADRYSYLACLGWPLLIGGGIFRLWPAGDSNQSSQRPFVATAVVVITIFALAILTWNQTQVWRTPRTLWQHAVTVTPYSSIAHYNLGRTLEREDKSNQAVESYRRAVSANPRHAKAHFNLARLLALKGLDIEAIDHYRQVLEIRPDHADAHNDLGLLLEMKGDIAAAQSEFQQTLRLEPNHDKAFFNLGELLAKQGDLAKATRYYQQAARINPNEAAIQIRLALVLARQGQLESATTHFLAAVKLKPDDAEAHVLLARSLVAQGKKDEAERYYREALRIMKTRGKTTGDDSRNSK